MNRLTDAADQYLKSCTWRDLALLKICVCALGVLIGLALPGRKKTARGLGCFPGVCSGLYPSDGEVFALPVGAAGAH